jgi:Ni,Fe-hydrogenase III small subunit
MSKRQTLSSGSSALLTVTLALACLSLTACATPRVVTETQTVEVVVERIVPVDPKLTRALPPPDRELVTWLDALVMSIEYRHRWESCETRMEEIRGLTDGLD